jgi:hypothetical protein
MNQGTLIVEQNGIRGVNMKIVEISRSEKNTVWNDGKTFLIVFDKKDNQVADYDFSTGLKILEKDNENIIFIYEDDLVSGRWKFYGSKVKVVEGKVFETKVESEGFQDGDIKKRKQQDKEPWNNNRVKGRYVSGKEREKRIRICRSCSFFNQNEGFCEINGMLSIETTKHETSHCPESKWGDIKKTSEILVSEKQVEDEIKKDQEKFNEDLERYLEEI